jgi:hypothetical protein
MANKIKRKFHIDDSDLLQQAIIKGSFFKQDKADFINFDSDFSDPFYDNLVLLIDACYNETTNKTLIYQQTQLSATVEENMQRCSEKFKEAKYFIEKAFPKNPAVWAAFGYKRYGKVRKSRLGLNGFMKTFHSFAVKYAAELIAKNYTQAMIDEIETFQETLENSILEHRSFIKSRSTMVNDRIVKMNELYDLVMEFCRAGQRIYKNDRAMLQRYLFKHFKKGRKLKVAA